MPISSITCALQFFQCLMLVMFTVKCLAIVYDIRAEVSRFNHIYWKQMENLGIFIALIHSNIQKCKNQLARMRVERQGITSIVIYSVHCPLNCLYIYFSDIATNLIHIIYWTCINMYGQSILYLSSLTLHLQLLDISTQHT